MMAGKKQECLTIYPTSLLFIRKIDSTPKSKVKHFQRNAPDATHQDQVLTYCIEMRIQDSNTINFESLLLFGKANDKRVLLASFEKYPYHRGINTAKAIDKVSEITFISGVSRVSVSNDSVRVP